MGSQVDSERMSNVLARELELDNFKSFGRRTVIPFRPGFTTIFGPNGSGKSNIVDSILFCLGLSTSKTMRAERLPDLLNNTSGKKEARVALRLELVDTQEVLEVARVIRLTKSGYTSTYYLDQKPVTREEVHHRLSDLHISPTGNNVVMQGDVTKILTMTALERRRIIDELAGVAEFDGRIEDAKEELDKAERHMEDTQLLLTEIQTRVEALAEERDNALKYKSLKEESASLERMVQYLELQARKKQLQNLEKQIELKNQERVELEEKRGDIENRIQDTIAKMALLQQEIRAKGEEQRVAKLVRLEEVKGELTRLEDRRGHLQSIVSEKQTRGRELASQIEEARKLTEEKSVALQDLRKQLAVHEKEAARLQSQLKKLQERLGKVNQDQADSIGELGRLRGELQEKKLAEMELRSYRNNLQATLQETEKLREESDRLVKELDEKLKALVDIRSDGENTRQNLQSEAQKAATRAELLRRDLLDRRNSLQMTERMLRGAIKDYSEAEARSQASTEGMAGRVLRVLLEAGIHGIRGTVGDLASIPKEYANAIGSAAGRRLDYIVVEDEQVAASCIELLKKAGAGRMTFLPMTKMRADVSLPHFSTPGFLGYAIELIEYDAAYHSIFAYVLGRTVIAKSMNYALPLLGRMRMVTLDGDLLEMSGAMTGGSRPQNRRGASKNDLEGRRRKLMELEQRVEALIKEIASIENELASVSTYQVDTRRTLDKLSVEIDRDQTEEERLTEQAEGARKRQAELADKCRALEAELEASGQELERVGALVKEQEGRLTGLDEQMAQLHLKDAAAQATGLEVDLRGAENRSLQVKEQIKAIELELEYLEKNRKVWAEDLENTEAEIGAIRSQIEETREASEKLFAEQEQMSGEITELSDAVKGLKAERDALNSQQDKLKEQREGIDARLFRIEGQIAQFSREFDGLLEQVEQLEAIEAELPPVLVPAGENLTSLRDRAKSIVDQMQRMEPINMLAIDQYDELAERHADLAKRLAALSEEKAELLNRMDQIGQQKFSTFMRAFDGINDNFQDIYAQLSAGHGKLHLENEEDPFAGGLIIRAQPKDKKMERMEAMSGGEKSLTALAFVFAFQSFEPAPFYVFDEVDSFLDGPNTERLAAMVRNHAETTQFIVVSHKASMLEKAQRTIGVYQPRNSYSQVKGLELDGYEAPKPDNVTSLPLPKDLSTEQQA